MCNSFVLETILSIPHVRTATFQMHLLRKKVVETHPVRQTLVFLGLYKLQVSNTEEEEKMVLLQENSAFDRAQVCNTITFVISYLF